MPPFEHEPDEGTPLTLTSAGEVETLVRAKGSTFVVTNRNGDITPSAARELGFFHSDTRHLSHYEVHVRNANLVHLSSNAFDAVVNRVHLMLSGLEDQEFLDDPRNFLHIERQQLVDDAFRERMELVNYLQHSIEIELEIRFAADFADVFELRGAKRECRGTVRAPRVSTDSVELAYDGLDRKTYTTSVTFQPTPSALDETRATFRLSIEPGGSTTIEVCAVPVDRTMTTETYTFEERARNEREHADGFYEASTRFGCDDGVLQRVLEQSTVDLRVLSLGLRGGRVLAGGIPWFACPFGRDTLITAYEALLLNPDLAASSLRVLAAFQGTKYDERTEEEPGRIFHELRFGEMAAAKEIPHSPYYGTIDATPLFVVVLHATHKTTGDDGLVAELAEPLRRALEWIDRRSAQGTELVTYQCRSKRGLDNQGWKDSRMGVSFPDGRRASPPIALSEVQGYCIDAYRRGSELLETLGDPDAARTYETRARTLSEVFERTFWLPEERRYAFAIDGSGAPLPTIASNVGHLLWSRVPSATRARATADLLTAPESLSPFGIRTLAARQPVYNPLSYHNGTIWPHDNALIAKGFANYDLMDHACSVFEALVGAMDHLPDRRLPELYCGMTRGAALVRYPVACSPQAWASAAPFLLLQAVLGIHVDARAQRLLVRNPKMPESIRRVEIDGLRVGRSRVSLRLRRVGKRCHVDRLDVSGAPLRTFVELA